MAHSRPFELCCNCDRPTGRAVKGEDSLYAEDDTGPYCQECWEFLPAKLKKPAPCPPSAAPQAPMTEERRAEAEHWLVSHKRRAERAQSYLKWHEANTEAEMLSDLLAEIDRLTAIISAPPPIPPPVTDDDDMAAVGRNLVRVIKANKHDPNLKGWHPTDCPSEIVGYLLNKIAALAEAAAETQEQSETAASNLRILDRIADLIGHSHDREMQQHDFEAWMDRQKVERDAAIAAAVGAERERCLRAIDDLRTAEQEMRDKANLDLDGGSSAWHGVRISGMRAAIDVIRSLPPPAPAQGEDRMRAVIGFVESWVSNPVGSYSVAALDGLFSMTRDRIAALSRAAGNPGGE